MTICKLGAFRRSPIWPVLAIALLARIGVAEEITAFAEPYRDIDVAAAESGTLNQLLVEEGERVSAGQQVATLNDEVLKVSMRMAEAGMNSRGKLNSAAAELRMQEERLKKILGLRERNHASQQEVDRTRAQKEIAQANLEAVREELEIKRIEHQRIAAQLRRRHLNSPIDGVVTLIQKDVGEFVSANDAVVMKVVQLDPLQVVFSAPKIAQGQLSTDDSVSVLIGEDRHTVQGVVEFVSPTIDPQSNTVRIKVRLPNRKGAIKSGTACRLLLPGQSNAQPDQLTITP